SAPALRLRRLISLARESRGGEATSASTREVPPRGRVLFPPRFQTIPALWRAVPQTAARTAFGSRAVAVSLRGIARTPIVPVTTHPPPCLATRCRRERRPLRVVAVTEISELIPWGATSTSRARSPGRLPGRMVNHTIFSCTISGPTRGAKIRPMCRETRPRGTLRLPDHLHWSPAAAHSVGGRRP